MITLFGKNLCESCFAENTKDPCEKCGFSSADYEQDATALPIGQTLQERYLIGGVIGKGGFGITYIAFDTKLERRVAVKEYYPYGLALRTPGTTIVSSPDADGDGVFSKGAEKFYDEARLVAKFSDNQNIVSIHDFFYENNTVYYVMEYLHGKSMKKYVETHGVVSAEQAVYIAKEVSNALVSSHSANVLHRDIAPDNIMLCNNGKVKLIDFGAARQVISEGSQSLSAILKQGFAPLEQYQKKGKQGPWTDIYALGTTIYYLMTGNLLDDPITRMEDDEAFSSNKYNINDELWTIIKKATMLKPADRYKDIFEFRDALNKTSLGSAPLTISYDAPFKIEAAAPAKEVFSVGETMPAKEASPVGETMPAKEASPVGATMPAKEASPVGATMPAKEASPVGATMPAKEAAPVGATMPAKETSSIGATMPAKEVSPIGETMPAKEASPIGATMPAKNTSDMRTMPVYDSAPQGSDVSREIDISARKKLIPIVSVFSAIIIVLVCVIAVLLNNSDEAEIIADETDIETSAAYEETSLTETTSASTEVVSEQNEQPPVTSVPDLAVSEPLQPDRSEPEQPEPSQPDRSEPEQSKPPQTSKTVTEAPKPAETTKPPATTTKPPVTTTKPPVTTTKPPATTTKPPATTTKPAKEKIPATVKIAGETYDTSKTGSLDLSSKKLTNSDIVNLKYMTKITALYLNDNDISDISPLANLTNLKKLNLNKNSISDISPLAKLTNLEELRLEKNKISDISPLAKLTNLKELDLDNNYRISDLSPLANLTNLNKLEICENKISDLSPLAKLTNIKKLELRGNRISDCSSLSNCKFTSLNLNDNPLNGNLKAFKGLKFEKGGTLYILGCGYDKYVTDGVPNKEFDDAMRNNIKFEDNFEVRFGKGNRGEVLKVEYTK